MLVCATFTAGLLKDIYNTASCFPEKMDLAGAALGLVRIQDVYRIDTKNMASGAFIGASSPAFTGESSAT